MTEFTLWQKRLSFLRKNRLQEFKMIADWTVWLYIIVPGIAIGAFLYRETFFNPPAWFQMIPSALFLLFPFYRGIQTFYRLHLNPADLNFLLSGPWDERKFAFFSMGWQCLKEIGLTLFFTLLFYPYLHSQLGFGLDESLLLALLYWMIQVAFLNLNWFFRQYGRFSLYVFRFLFLPLIGLGVWTSNLWKISWDSPFLFAAGGISIFLSLLLVWKQKNWDWGWLIQESVRRNRPLSLSFIMEPEEYKNKKYTKLSFLPFMKKSWSDHVELSAVSKELTLKIFFRRSSQWRYILIQLFIGSMGILFVQTFSMKVFILTAVVLLMYQLLKSSQAEIEKRLLHRVSPVDINIWREGRNQGLLLLMASFALFFVAVLILSLQITPAIAGLHLNR